jgi:16S rRNA A1518/A1519 N6-dimethyltransferase RsmA/KsgA/DIM1 with predicted DNA glycosylase/AP lyase activity
VRPRKRFGQHFLEDVWVGKVIGSSTRRADEVFLEIGPGRAALALRVAGRRCTLFLKQQVER